MSHQGAERGPVAAAGVGDVFAADDEVGPDLAVVDWGATPLGPSNEWPQSLRTALSILLSSRFSMWMAWGPELTFFCNAAYRWDTLGRKYPWALGRPASEVWAEIWDDISPRIESVLATGKATWDEALLLFLERSGFPEETYHTFSYSPLWDDGGAVVGMFCVVSEDTERVIGERRMATLRDLGSDLSAVRTERESLAFAAGQLSRRIDDLPFTLTYLFDDDGGARLAATSGIITGPRAAAPTLSPTEGAELWPVEKLAAGRSELVDLDGAPFTGMSTGAWPEPPTRALAVPLPQPGDAPYGFLVAALNRYRPLDEGYRGFVELVAGYVAAGVAGARSYQAQQQRAEELAALDRAKTSFFSNISHEFRTPLTLILGPVTELREQLAGNDGLRAELEVIHRNGLRLHKLVNTLLDFSRLEAGRMQARYEQADLAALTAELASVFRSAVDKAGLGFTVDCPPLDEPVYIDRDMWERVVLNLLSNALKFTFDGSIDVVVRGEDTHATVTVSDTGVGVPAAEMPRLFERFHRIETAHARSSEGSGIGLSLVKELVGLHGGTITAASTVGQGTSFTIRLPFGSAHLPADALAPATGSSAASAATDPYVQEALRWLPGNGPSAPSAGDISPAAPAGTAVAPVSGSGAPARVVVADDNTDMREYLTRLLGGAGYRVDAVADGRQALDSVRADRPDLVVADVMMPRLDGLALLAALRDDPHTATVPVLLLSARAGQEASIEGLHAGADDYLAKPFTAAELLARARATAELARLRNHHARWRAALVNSLQEGFFVCDDAGMVLEINAAFTDILGYGPENLPYGPIHPWWPDARTDPEAHRQVTEAFDGLVDPIEGGCTIPLTHRDGHRVWVTATFNQAQDPETGRAVIVGTVRDVTAEHYTVQRETALAALTEQLADADTVEAVLPAAAEELRRVWQARRVLAVLFPAPNAAPAGETAEPEVVCAGEPARWSDLPAAVRHVIGSLRDGGLLTTASGPAGAAGIALQHPRGVLVVRIELAERRPFTPEDQTLLTVLAGRLGQGLQRLHLLDQQRQTALAFQHAILGPASLPRGFAVRYQPASRPLQVGGDWYDVVELDDRHTALVVGDCVGHGLAAATVMGQLRSACRALLLEHPSPGAALTGLDRFAAQLPGAACTTAFCAVLDSTTGALTYASAGHPPPILVHPDHTIRTLADGRAIPLGLRPDHPRPEAQATMPPHATLMLYTDGLVERRRQNISVGIAHAADLVQDGHDTAVDDLAGDILGRLAPTGGYGDDVVLLLYRRPGQPHAIRSADTGQPSRRGTRLSA